MTSLIKNEVVQDSGEDQVGGGARPDPDGSSADGSGAPRICVHVPLRRFFLVLLGGATVRSAVLFARNERMASRLYPAIVAASRIRIFVSPNTWSVRSLACQVTNLA
jgi:hypothetical protein